MLKIGSVYRGQPSTWLSFYKTKEDANSALTSKEHTFTAYLATDKFIVLVLDMEHVPAVYTSNPAGELDYFLYQVLIPDGSIHWMRTTKFSLGRFEEIYT
jgi:hypothetical protein